MTRPLAGVDRRVIDASAPSWPPAAAVRGHDGRVVLRAGGWRSASGERRAVIDAPPAAVWAVLADLGALADWAAFVDHVWLPDGGVVGLGARRRVQIGRRALLERVTTWEPDRALAYDVELPAPFVGAARTTWRLSPERGATLVAVRSEVERGAHPLGLVVAHRAAARLAAAAEVVLVGLAGEVERRGAATAGAGSRGVGS